MESSPLWWWVGQGAGPGESQLQAGRWMWKVSRAVSEGEAGQAAKAWKAPKPEGEHSNELLGQ